MSPGESWADGPLNPGVRPRERWGRHRVSRLPNIFKTLGLKYDEKVLPSIGNEVLKAVVAQLNADQLLTERPHVSALVRDSLVRRAKDFNIVLDDVAITHLSYGAEFSKAVEQKQVAQQEAKRSKFVVMKAGTRKNFFFEAIHRTLKA